MSEEPPISEIKSQEPQSGQEISNEAGSSAPPIVAETTQVSSQPAADITVPASAVVEDQPGKQAVKSGRVIKKKAVRQNDEAQVAADPSKPEAKEGQPAKKKAKQNQKGNNNDSEQDDQNSGEGARKQVRRGRTRGSRGNNQRQEGQEERKVKLDDKLVSKRAWKIFLGEVNEEGLVLVGDKEARDLAKRSLRVAEIYSREEALLKTKGKQGKKKSNPAEKGSDKSQPESVGNTKEELRERPRKETGPSETSEQSE